MAFRFTSIARAMLALGTSGVLAQATTAGVQPLSVRVLVQDETDSSPATLATARTIAGRIFARAGVRIEWLDAVSAKALVDARTGTADRATFFRSLYRVHLVTRMADRRAVSSSVALGFAAPGTRAATVVYDRVQQVSRASGADSAMVLGHAVAHELGHLLLGRTSHSANGLMRAKLDVERAAQGRLWFTAQEEQGMRARLAGAGAASGPETTDQRP